MMNKLESVFSRLGTLFRPISYPITQIGTIFSNIQKIAFKTEFIIFDLNTGSAHSAGNVNSSCI